MASFIAMSAMWDGSTAALILAVLLVHEAGHAIAMRLSGYRDVHVFFVPLLGALTIGHPAAASVAVDSESYSRARSRDCASLCCC
jgi:hypothetical protein